jgi:hypothetical protein
VSLGSAEGVKTWSPWYCVILIMEQPTGSQEVLGQI